MLESLVEFGAFHPGCDKEVECLRYCFMDLVQKDLDEARREWNTHLIRPSRGARCPAGVPDELYFVPRPPAVNCLLTDVGDLLQEVLAELEELSSFRSS